MYIDRLIKQTEYEFKKKILEVVYLTAEVISKDIHVHLYY